MITTTKIDTVKKEVPRPARPVPVMTSKLAKNHLFQAKAMMDEVYKGIVDQRNRLNQMAASSQKTAMEQNKMQQEFTQQRMLSQAKINAVNPLQ
jgi:hypothetical protein